MAAILARLGARKYTKELVLIWMRFEAHGGLKI
jgi:hypothetical protein